jgi:hypothetical protein
MSFRTWELEFYPITAEEAAKGSAKAATIHSIRKWEGLRPAALKRHGVAFEDNLLSDGIASLGIDSESCALCEKFYGHSADSPQNCSKCPLAKARDGVPCDRAMDCEDEDPYSSSSSNPEPMIAWLGKALSECK